MVGTMAFGAAAAAQPDLSIAMRTATFLFFFLGDVAWYFNVCCVAPIGAKPPCSWLGVYIQNRI